MRNTSMPSKFHLYVFLYFFFFFTINTIGSSLKFQNEIQGQTQEKQENLSGQSKTKSIAAGAQQY